MRAAYESLSMAVAMEGCEVRRGRVRKAALGSLLALGLSLLGGTGTASAQAVEWTFNNNFAPQRLESGTIRDFAADVDKRSNGNFKVRVIEGGGMGLPDADAVRWMQQGTPQLGAMFVPFLGRDAPELATLYVYGLITTVAEHQKALPTVKDILREGMKKWNIEPIGFIGLSPVEQSIFCRQPVKTLDDLRKVKLRVGTRDQIETFKAVGVSAQFIPQNDLYAAMQTGVVDCALYPARDIHTLSLQEVAKFSVATAMPTSPIPYVIMTNKGEFEKLSPENKQVLLDAFAKVEQDTFDFSKVEEVETASREKLTAMGMTFFGDLPEADQKELRAAAKVTWKTIMTEAGEGALENRRRVAEALGIPVE